MILETFRLSIIHIIQNENSQAYLSSVESTTYNEGHLNITNFSNLHVEKIIF